VINYVINGVCQNQPFTPPILTATYNNIVKHSITSEYFKNWMIICRSTAKPSYYKGPKHESLKNMTVGHLIDEAAKQFPNREAIVSVHQNRKITFSDLKHEVV